MQFLSVNTTAANPGYTRSRSKVAYPAFGSGISEMQYLSDTNVKYRYGFNGMEIDNHFANDGSIYTTDYRQYDCRIGRWFTTDPLQVSFNTPYQIVGEDPINNTDKSGATLDPKPGSTTTDQATGISTMDVAPSINGTLYIRFDENLNLTEDQKKEYVAALQKKINETIGQMSYNGMTVTSNTKVEEYAGTEKELFGSNTKMSANCNIFDVGREDPNHEKNNNELNVSNTNNDRTHGFLNYGTGKEDISHELGHILGLSDRYCATVTGNGAIHNIECPTLAEGSSIPMVIDSDSHYDPQNNLMSGAGKGNLTQMQIGYIFSKQKEPIYKTAIIGMNLAGLDPKTFNCVRITGNAIFGFKAYAYQSVMINSPRAQEIFYKPVSFQSNSNSVSNLNCFYLNIFKGISGNGDSVWHYITKRGVSDCGGNQEHVLSGNIDQIKKAGAIR